MKKHGFLVLALFSMFCSAAAAQSFFWLAAADGNMSYNNLFNEPVLNNKYILESIRSSNLARQAFADGDYDLSIRFSADAQRAAYLSDDFIVTRLKVSQTNEKIKDAEARLGWADSSNAKTYYKNEFNNARAFYNKALLARTSGDWDSALNNAAKSIEILAVLVAPPNRSSSNETVRGGLPAQYTVRPWDAFGDCFWNIAGRAWAYNNPYQWPVLYRANRNKLADPTNPNIIEPGTVLDIPSIHGEIRQGMWDSGKKYSPLR
ncbi:MAG: LysM peptidoglycan-binding domain-containing protein [Spirochaetaceae bacterium]|jgi:tetratricopeptide (TPR) repeat protein|nr:LysM peptidoglycan-binding domain-containing protein [Spirochaetaceae bacterium]GMO28804.1 MAG: DUF4398 domain-containing protein [Termitinemataceae bacterium]